MAMESRWSSAQDPPFGEPQTPDQMGAIVAFLASDLARYITGTVVTAEWGWLPAAFIIDEDFMTLVTASDGTALYSESQGSA